MRQNIYFVSDTDACTASVDTLLRGEKAHWVEHMAAIGYHEATYDEYRRKRAWQRRQEKEEGEENG